MHVLANTSTSPHVPWSVHLTTLGESHLRGSRVKRPKLLILLVYLALEGQQSREHLRTLFWPEAADPAGSLRAAVAYLQSNARGAIMSSGPIVRADVTCDAVTFLARLDEGMLDTALQSYKGPFLAGLDAQLPPELQEWVLGTRDALAERARMALLNLGEAQAARLDFRQGAQYARAAWTLLGPPAVPEVMDSLYRLLLAGEDPATALEVKRAAAEYGLLLQSTPTDAQAILQSATNEVAPPHGTRRGATNFIGRIRELADLMALLDRPDVRLVTLLGPGGVGKTRLALELMTRSHIGTTIVRLEAVNDTALVASAVAVGLGVPGGMQEIKHHLAATPTLLVLDNFEHLRPATAFVEELLEACPHLTVLVTSRERLGASGEWLFPLKGLQVPDEQADQKSTLEAEAAQLFQRRAQQVNAAWMPTCWQDVALICQALHGLPLALELAASLTRVLPLTDLIREIQQDLTVLDAGHIAYERHGGLSVVFEQSWATLIPAERTALSRMSIGQSSLTRPALTEIAGVTLPLLTSLVDKSLVQVESPGRYAAHPLVRAFAEKRLSLRERQEMEQRFLEYHLGWLESEEREAPQRAVLVQRIAEEWGNVRQAWGLGVKWGRASRLLALKSIAAYLERQAAYTEGHRLYAALTEELRNDPNGYAAGRSFAAWFAFRMGDHRLAEHSAKEVLAHTAGEFNVQARLAYGRALNTLACVQRATGAHDEAMASWEEAYTVARHIGDATQQATYLTNLAVLYAEKRRMEDAVVAHQAALDLARQQGHTTGVALAGSHLVRILLLRGELEDPSGLLQLLDELQQTAEQADHAALLGYLAAYKAEVHLRLGQDAPSWHCAEQAQAIADAKGLPALRVPAFIKFAELRRRQGHLDESWSWVHRAIQEALALPDRTQLAGALLLLAEFAEPPPNWWPHLPQLAELSEREIKRLERLPPPETPSITPPSLEALANEVLHTWVWFKSPTC